jgi:hypothetical protein
MLGEKLEDAKFKTVTTGLGDKIDTNNLLDSTLDRVELSTSPHDRAPTDPRPIPLVC